MHKQFFYVTFLQCHSRDWRPSDCHTILEVGVFRISKLKLISFNWESALALRNWSLKVTQRSSFPFT